jgi:hypothetical protein
MVGNASALRRVVGLGVCLVVAILPASQAGAETVPLSRFGPDGTEATNFDRIGSAAVDQQSGALYVLDGEGEALLKFGPAGEPIAFGGSNPDITDNRIDGITPFTDNSIGKRAASQVAVDPVSHVVYVTEEHAVRAFDPEGEPVEFTAGPGAGSNEIPGFTKLFGVAVDVNGAIYAVDGAGGMSVFAATGAPLATVPLAEESFNLALAADGAVYLITEQGKLLAKLSPSSFPVSESTTYAGSTFAITKFASAIDGVAVDPTSGIVYLLETNFSESWIREYSEAGALVGSVGEPGTGEDESTLGGAAQGLAVLGVPAEIGPGETVKFYVGDTDASTSQVVLFGSKIVIGPPSVSALRVTDVTADSAVLRASVNPNTGSTTYRFEYGLDDCSISVCTSVPVGGANIGEGHEPIPVSQAIAGLSPSTTYHYRVVAENPLGPPSEVGGTFTTQANGLGFELSDSRVWEMVSPPDKRGARLLGSAIGLIQAAADGNGLSYLSVGSIEADPEGNRNREASQVMARWSADGWSSKDITPSNVRTIPLGIGSQSEYKLFTPDLGTALLDPRDGTALSPLATERTPYLRDEAEPPVFTPLVTAAEGVANVPAGREFGGRSDSPHGDVRVAGADQDLEHIVLTSAVSLLEDPAAPPALYLWDAGQLEPVSILPDSEGGTMPSPVLLGSGPGSVRNAVSEDGSRVFWSPGNYGSGFNELTGLYLRDTTNDETVRLDTIQGGSGTGIAHPLFQGANQSGTIVYFTDSQRLTANASPDGFDLYRCEIPADNTAGGCATLTNLTGSVVSGGESAEVLWLVQGMSDAADRLYFVAEGVLGGNENQFGDSAEPGEPNLYFWEEGATPRFVATLSAEDQPDWGGRLKQASEVSAATSPDGRYLSFMSQRKLTGQPNEDLTTGDPVEHVFVYDAVSEALQCVSCNPTGSASQGEVLEDQIPVDPQRQWDGHLVTATVPQATINETGGPSLYRPRGALDGGRVFFNSLDGLVSADSNGQWDVYQFEPLGQGTCTASSGGSAVVRSGNGCVSLISSGTASEESAFLDASANGDDVFFLSPARLSAWDKDLELDVYDARVGGRAVEPAPASECVGEACRPSPPSPAYANPNSSTFSGKGNLKPGKKCPKGKKKVRKHGKVRCVPRNKHSKSQKRHRQGDTKGRVSR